MTEPTVPTRPACVFCARIHAGEFDRESAYAVAFPPRHPVTDGHMLVIPRVHLRDAAESPSHAADAFVMAAQIAGEVGDCNLITSIGAKATQTVFHLHFHVVPRRAGDGLALPWTGQRKDIMDRHGRPLGGPLERDARLLAANVALDLTEGSVDNGTRGYWADRVGDAYAQLDKFGRDDDIPAGAR